ncbi:hypothetical protein CLV62_101289 [Dysgonomonas alginatilytica]|uniref:C1q domain-containing protein n=1 Tax=Dysgonomonas alginatilytica TaxID=1605892 RepID=A0A2V3PV74_9BACT|nr:hypothetical protein [Dysgonomonas alginatilytica]PXV69022.1 hypothetical protein CLV62_101289 [Dysgonomonas alginatilytica]
MKKIILSGYVFIISASVFSQVGINTRTPYTNSVFHIDAKGNNTSATSVTRAQEADDVVIDKSGNIGVGVVNPTAKVHIDSSKGTIKPLRLADGSQGINKYFFSDTQGRGTWKDKPMPNGIVYYSTTPKTLTKNVFTELPVEVNSAGYSRITIPRAGNYVFTLRWWGALDAIPIGTKLMSTATIQLCRYVSSTTSTVLDQTTYYTSVTGVGGSTTRFSFTVSFFASNLPAGDILFLRLRPDDGYNWLTGASLAADQVKQTIYYPSIMVYNI